MPSQSQALSRSSIDQVIQRSINPFNPAIKSGDFWQEEHQESLEVKSIHKEILDKVEDITGRVAQNQVTQTILLQGDSGSGKSYLLGRMKRQLNDQAFFVYVGPAPSRDYCWRHTLRKTIDSLVQIPEGEHESQLLLWLKNLLQKQNKSRPGKSVNFVTTMRAAYPVGIYRSRDFFRALYALTDDNLRSSAYDWLRGDDLDEDELRKLKIGKSIDSEDSAQKILSNFGRISRDTQPIVICFDQVDNWAPTPNGEPDIQSMMHINSTFHNERLKNFLIVISAITNTWQEMKSKIQPADLASISQTLRLKSISLRQIEEIWASQLYPLHHLATPKPGNSIYPFTQEWLEAKIPAGKALVRNALSIGEQAIDHYKARKCLPPTKEPQPTTPTIDRLASHFSLMWEKEFKLTMKYVTKIKHFSSPELAQKLQEALEALGVNQIESSILPSPSYSANSLGFHNPDKIGVVWSEESNLSTFCNVMKACKKLKNQGKCKQIFLIRLENVGASKNAGNKIYRQLFTSETHIKPALDSLYFLETYHRLFNASCSHELALGGHTINVKQLQSLVRKTKVLDCCPILQDLLSLTGPEPTPPIDQLAKARKYALDILKTQFILGRTTLFKNIRAQFSKVTEEEFDKVLAQLIEFDQVEIVNSSEPLSEQILCLKPS